MTAHEIARFLEALAATGNFALACQLVGRVKSGLYKRRARDPLFAAKCAAALAIFYAANSHSPRRGEGRGEGVLSPDHADLPLESAPALANFHTAASPSPRRGEGRGEGVRLPDCADLPLKSAPGSLKFLPARGTRPAQLRRAPPGSLTQAGLEEFLQALSVSGNVRLAAASIGAAPSSIHRRRKTDPGFARRFKQACNLARHALQLMILEQCDRTFDLDYREELRAAGEDPDVERITTAQALQFLAWLDRRGQR